MGKHPGRKVIVASVISSELIIDMPAAGENGMLRLAAGLRTGNRLPLRLWFDVPAELQDRILDGAAPFVMGMIFSIMRAGRPVRVRGAVPPSLLRNLDDFMAVWHAWHPDRYQRVDIVADDEIEEPRHPDAPAVSGFSGGLDSCHTAWWHNRGSGGRQQKNLRAGIFVRGFDIPLSEKNGFASALRNNRAILDSVGMEILPLATNFREQPIDWENSHASGLAACMALFRGWYSTGLIASTFTHDVLGIKWGSTPFTDRLFSSDSFTVQTDAADTARLSKVRALKEWPEAMRYMRVCWEGSSRDANCCRCEKCIRTIMAFRIVECPQPPCFPHPVSDDQIRALRPNQPVAAAALCNLLEQACAAGMGNESWVKALATAKERFSSSDTSST